MNTAVVLPALQLGRAVDQVVGLSRGETTPTAVTLAALLFVSGTLATEVPRIGKRWWLMTANNRIRPNIRTDVFEAWSPGLMARLHRTPIGDLMARTVGDVEVLRVGVREFTIEIWDTVLFCISFVVAMLLIDAPLTASHYCPYRWRFSWRTRWDAGRRSPQLVNSVQGGAAAYARLEPLLAPPLSVVNEPRFASFLPGRLVALDRLATPTRDRAYSGDSIRTPPAPGAHQCQHSRLERDCPAHEQPIGLHAAPIRRCRRPGSG
jgi:ABC-type multidrug transport system fused ATPase/permease subunit